MDKSREEFVRDWLNLKKNVDADVMTWTKLSKSTQVQLKGFRKIYQNFEVSDIRNKLNARTKYKNQMTQSMMD